MRISDWSSDVCSSDLHILLIRCPAGSIDAGRSKDRGRWRMAAIGCRRAKLLGSAVSVSVSVFGFASLCVPQVARSEERRVGKSGSVRVDRGGLRSIKKKTHTHWHFEEPIIKIH